MTSPPRERSQANSVLVCRVHKCIKSSLRCPALPAWSWTVVVFITATMSCCRGTNLIGTVNAAPTRLASPMSFIDGLGEDAVNDAIVRLIVNFAHTGSQGQRRGSGERAAGDEPDGHEVRSGRRFSISQTLYCRCLDKDLRPPAGVARPHKRLTRGSARIIRERPEFSAARLVKCAPRDRVEKSFRGGSQAVVLSVYRRPCHLRQVTLQLGAELCQLVSVGQVKVHLIGRR